MALSILPKTLLLCLALATHTSALPSPHTARPFFFGLGALTHDRHQSDVDVVNVEEDDSTRSVEFAASSKGAVVDDTDEEIPVRISPRVQHQLGRLRGRNAYARGLKMYGEDLLLIEDTQGTKESDDEANMATAGEESDNYVTIGAVSKVRSEAGIGEQEVSDDEEDNYARFKETSRPGSMEAGSLNLATTNDADDDVVVKRVEKVSEAEEDLDNYIVLKKLTVGNDVMDEGDNYVIFDKITKIDVDTDEEDNYVIFKKVTTADVDDVDQDNYVAIRKVMNVKSNGEEKDNYIVVRQVAEVNGQVKKMPLTQADLDLISITHGTTEVSVPHVQQVKRSSVAESTGLLEGWLSWIVNGENEQKSSK